jgi:hypothetical protein
MKCTKKLMNFLLLSYEMYKEIDEFLDTLTYWELKLLYYKTTCVKLIKTNDDNDRLL